MGGWVDRLVRPRVLKWIEGRYISHSFLVLLHQPQHPFIQLFPVDGYLALRTPKAGPRSRSDPRDHILLRVRD